MATQTNRRKSGERGRERDRKRERGRRNRERGRGKAGERKKAGGIEKNE